MVIAEDSDEEDSGSENELDLGMVITRVGTDEDDHPKCTYAYNIDDKRRLVQKELGSGCGCPHNCYSQFCEDEMYSIRLKMTELEKLEHDMLILGKLQVSAAQQA